MCHSVVFHITVRIDNTNISTNNILIISMFIQSLITTVINHTDIIGIEGHTIGVESVSVYAIEITIVCEQIEFCIYTISTINCAYITIANNKVRSENATCLKIICSIEDRYVPRCYTIALTMICIMIIRLFPIIVATLIGWVVIGRYNIPPIHCVKNYRIDTIKRNSKR